jgi:hypothetical protein
LGFEPESRWDSRFSIGVMAWRVERIANGNNPSGNQSLAGNSLKFSNATAAPCDVIPLEQRPLRAGKTSSTVLMGDCGTILFKS